MAASGITRARPPLSGDHTMTEHTTTTNNRDVAIEKLGVEVGFVKSEMDGIRQNVNQLAGKVDSAVNDLGREMRRAIDGLSQQLNERAKTPWAVVFAGITVLFILIGFIGHQALDPMSSDIAALKLATVPRTELTMRAELNDRRVIRLEEMIKLTDERRYEERTKIIDRLTQENLELRRGK
jgi:hypothetical protein